MLPVVKECTAPEGENCTPDAEQDEVPDEADSNVEVVCGEEGEYAED